MLARFLCLLSLLVVCQWSLAAENNLYQTTVPVTSRAKAQYQQAVSLALQQVLVKVSGDRAVASLPAIEMAQTQAGKFVQAYRYINKKTGAKRGLRLQVEFESTAIKQILQQAGQSIWGTERPVLIAWIVLATDQDRQLISETSPLVPQLIQRDAEQRGIAVVLPILDLEDVTQISPDAVWNADALTLRTVSKRYGADAIVSARLQQLASDIWQVEWTLLLRGQALSWSNEGATQSDVIQAGIDHMADALASRFAVVEEQPSDVKLTVLDIESAQDYTKILAYLRSLTPVTDVQVRGVGGNQVVYDVHLTGKLTTLLQALTLQTMLVPVENPMSEQGSRLTYRLVT